MTAAAAMALAKAHDVEIALDSRGVLVMRSYGPIPPDVRLALKSAKPELIALFARDRASALTGDELLEALRARGFVINLTGSDRDLRDIVAERRPLFEKLLAWQAPSSPP
jgi:hypothetical protein